VCLRREVDDGVYTVLPQQAIDQAAIPNVAVHKGMSIFCGQSLEVLAASSIGQRIEIDEADARPRSEEVADEIGADEAGTAGHEYVLHGCFSLLRVLEPQAQRGAYPSGVEPRLNLRVNCTTAAMNRTGSRDARSLTS